MKQILTVIPLGPGDPGMMTVQAADLLCNPDFRIVLRTARHPVAVWLNEKKIPFESLDAFYERYDDFDEMHAAMASSLWEMSLHNPVGFAVMDPRTDGAVSALIHSRPSGSDLQILPGVSISEACLSSIPESHTDDHVLTIISASDFHRFSPDPDISLLITELNSSFLAGEIKLKLTDLYPEEMEVFFFPSSEEPFRKYLKIPLHHLDSQKKYDHTSAVFLPGTDYLHRTRHTFGDLAQIMSRLRSRNGCPWDSVQTHKSLRPYLIEEAWEAVNAIDDNDMDHLADELGDVLFQIVFHACIGQSFDEFTMTDIISGICSKMIRRHPHVFQTPENKNAADIADGWEKQKREETGSKTVGDSLKEIATSLPSLKYSIKCYKKLAQIPALKRDPALIANEISQLAQRLSSEAIMSEETMGLLLMKCTELCFRNDSDAETILHQCVKRIIQRFQQTEKELHSKGKTLESLSLEELNHYFLIGKD